MCVCARARVVLPRRVGDEALEHKEPRLRRVVRYLVAWQRGGREIAPVIVATGP